MAVILSKAKDPFKDLRDSSVVLLPQNDNVTIF